MRDLLVTLPAGVRPRLGLEDELRSAIRSGRLVAGQALPSSRALATDLGIARSTVVAAYEQLAVEGYLVATQGRSTTVAAVAIATATPARHTSRQSGLTHDFRPGEPALGSFPRRDWQQALRRVINQAPDEIFGYGDPRGRRELRQTIAGYVSRVRGVHADAAATRIFSGFGPSLGFMGEMLRRKGIDRVAVEQPMLGFHRDILRLVGVQPVPIGVDEYGLRVQDLVDPEIRAVLVTPGNQQPLGITMSSTRRAELIAWAHRVDGWIVEDDYDGEFRYDRRPIGAMQGLDPERVLYAGTASKSLGPGIHLSWLVVPAALRPDLDAVTHLRAGVPTIDQLALADFIERGGYDRHVRRQRRLYRQRRNTLIEKLDDVSWLTVTSSQAGMHLVALFGHEAPLGEAAVIAKAAGAGVALIGLETHFDHDEPGLVINVSRPADHQFPAAVDALMNVLTQAPTRHTC